MRPTRFLTFLAALVAVVATIGAFQPAQGRQTEGDDEGGKSADLVIVKVVDGDGPTGGYVIEWSCDFQGKGSGEGGSGGVLNFDAAAPGAPETQIVDVNGPGICTVEEIDSNGADAVAYACEFQPGQPPQSGDDGPFATGAEGRVGSCVDDRSADYASPLDVGTITVTNTFEADVLPDDDEPEPEPQADVVAAAPGFTG
jgi:hypothetical protein